MAKSISTISLSHDVRNEDGVLFIPAMAYGRHFDVVFGPEVAFEAADTLLSFLKEIIDRMKSENPAVNPADVFSQVTIDGSWTQLTKSHGDLVLSQRLRLHATGWSYKNIEGLLCCHGTLNKTMEEA